MNRSKYIAIDKVLCPNHNKYSKIIDAIYNGTNSYIVNVECGCELVISNITSTVRTRGEI